MGLFKNFKFMFNKLFKKRFFDNTVFYGNSIKVYRNENISPRRSAFFAKGYSKIMKRSNYNRGLGVPPFKKGVIS